MGLGALLTQTVEDEERVIAFASRALSDPETRYSVTEHECLAVVWAIQKFRPYLEGYRFTVITDHSSLRWLHNLKNPTGRLARWALELLEYDYEVIHRKGALHHVPDALSRMFETDSTEDTVLAATNSAHVTTAIDTVDLTNTTDEWYRKRYKDVITTPEKYTQWKVIEGRLYFLRPKRVVSEIVEDLDRWKLVIPQEYRKEVLRESHDMPQAGHLGTEKTYQRVAVSYFWPNLFRDVTDYIRQCDLCQRTKVEQASPAGLMGRRIADGPWTAIVADIIGSKAGFQYLLVIQDLFTKWVECKALRAATGPKITEALEDLVISRWGAPRFLLTDNGTEFVNKVMKAFAETRQITHTTVPPYHPQANPVERVNRILKTMIIAFIEKDHREWDKHISDFRYAYNTACHSSLGASPAFLNLGRELEPVCSLGRRSRGVTEIEPGDTVKWADRMKKIQALREWVLESLDRAYERQASRYNLRRRGRTFKVGDLVLKRQHILSSAAHNIAAKLAYKFQDPFKIVRAISPVIYELEQLDGLPAGKIHIQDLKPYNLPDTDT
ncbi:RNA-directed DNA polymerase [Camponotus japonicus]